VPRRGMVVVAVGLMLLGGGQLFAEITITLSNAFIAKYCDRANPRPRTSSSTSSCEAQLTQQGRRPAHRGTSLGDRLADRGGADEREAGHGALSWNLPYEVAIVGLLQRQDGLRANRIARPVRRIEACQKERR